jgi:hypothetical protein
MIPSQIKKVLTVAIRENFNVLLKGSPGVGKTDVIKAVCHGLGVDLLVLHPVVDAPEDYKGFPFALDGVADFLPFANLQQMIDAKKKLVVFLDDLGQANESVQKALMQLLLGGVINGKPISEHVMFIAATNSSTDKAGVHGLLEPVKSRFHTIIQFDVDVDEWLDWYLDSGRPVEIAAFIKLRPDLLTQFTPDKKLVNSCSPRTVTNAADWFAQGFGVGDNEVFEGAMGEAAATQLLHFLKTYKGIAGLPEEIVTKPNEARIPTDLSLLSALAGAVSFKATEDNLENICTYSDRLKDQSPEFALMMVKTCTDSKPDLMQTMPYIQWLSNNGQHFAKGI